MMDGIRFQHPEYLALFVFFLILAILARKRRQHVVVASAEQVVRSPFIARFVVGLPLFCWFVLSCLLVAALAHPQTSFLASYITIDSKKAMVCVDASASMGEGLRGTAMERIKDMLYEFAKNRLAKGDFLGVSAYSGQTNSSRGYGYARTIQYPTQDEEIVSAAVNVLRPSMFGNYSAVGDGVLVSIISLIEPQARKIFAEKYDRMLLEDNLWSLGTSKEDVEYAQQIAAALGKLKGHYIVLFTDGKYNTGMNPASALWFAEHLGIRVHFIAFASTAATGLSREEQQRRKAKTIEAVLRTGGTYKESVDVEGVAMLLKEIDSIEKVKVTIEEEPKRKSLRKVIIFGTAAVFWVWVLCWSIWNDPL